MTHIASSFAAPADCMSDCMELSKSLPVVTTPTAIVFFTISGLYYIQGGKRLVQLIRKISRRCLTTHTPLADGNIQGFTHDLIGPMKAGGKTIKILKNFSIGTLPLGTGCLIYFIPTLIKDVGCQSLSSICNSFDHKRLSWSIAGKAVQNLFDIVSRAFQHSNISPQCIDLGAYCIKDCVQFSKLLESGTTPAAAILFCLSGFYFCQSIKRTVRVFGKMVACCKKKKGQINRLELEYPEIVKKTAGAMKVGGKCFKLGKTVAKGAISLASALLLYSIPILIREYGCSQVFAVCTTLCESGIAPGSSSLLATAVNTTAAGLFWG